jgi:hypothetical protein
VRLLTRPARTGRTAIQICTAREKGTDRGALVAV